MRNLLAIVAKLLGLTLVLGGAYLVFWPVPVDPVAWEAPEDAGYVGDYAPNTRLAALKFIDIAGRKGPEDAAIGPDGLIYMATHDGEILRTTPEGPAELFATTGGRPLGIEFGPDGTLYIADAFQGLMAADANGLVRLLTAEAEGTPIRYANDVDIAPDGRIYFTDSSMRFGAGEIGSTLAASVLDLVEHSATGRVLRYDPATGDTKVLATGLSFANGLALDSAAEAIFVLETGGYRLWRYPIEGGAGEVVLSNLPGFPDNLNRAPDGSLWFGLVSPRNAIMDRLSGNVFARRLIMRLPEKMKPAPTRYGFVIRLDSQGKFMESLQDPIGDFALTTGAIPLEDGRLIVTSLTEPRLGILPAETQN